MKKLIATIKNIYNIEELRNRILYTLGIVLIYRVGSYIALPGVDVQALANTSFTSSSREGLLGLLDMFSGGAFSNASIFALGIMPYISASIVIQLMTLVVPYFQRLQKEGESGRKKINQLTRFLTIAVTALQAPAYLTNLVAQVGLNSGVFHTFTGEPIVAGSGLPWSFTFVSIIVLVSSTLFIMWLGERITDKGIGNGISLLIMVGIIARLPFALSAEFVSKVAERGNGGLITFLIELLVLLAVVLISILLVQGTRKVPVQYAKRIVGNKQYGGQRQYLPIKVNAAGVMPIIFAQAIMFLPLTLMGFASNSETMGALAAALTNNTGFWYNFIFAILIILFTYFYTAITFNPNQIADDMKKNGGFIPGIKPGKKTVEFIDNVISKVTLPGSIFLAFIAIMPAFARIFGINSQFAQFFGGTSLLIMVGVVLDTLQQIESHLLMRHYDGLTKSGRIKGRSTLPI
ncbi:MAG TPA: preprotein translocase subunit SecY [Bacteroidales bacterium]|nr:preprotein translocase subunit SecY [Bacteroidales bacterium]HON20609.1 preprotein translocase subunit SecY [Bacteroidales bacterium]HOR81414.1 preprotein translocase subunit SecY [Bacteroidales bacterium]HPJ90589.1 preprotein translocase subunit SecY [Bacteroidales bacterium]